MHEVETLEQPSHGLARIGLDGRIQRFAGLLGVAQQLALDVALDSQGHGVVGFGFQCTQGLLARSLGVAAHVVALRP